MKLFKNLLASVALASTLGVAGSANATLTNWYLDSDGPGGNSAILVQDYLDLVGQAYVHNTFGTSATAFTFNESAIFSSSSADGPVGIGTPVAPPILANFTGTGSGTIGGLLTFSTGALTVKSGATTIGTFNLLSGSGNLQAGTVLPNGAVSFIFQATSVMAGYFFDSSMNDLATLLASGAYEFGFATTNVIPLSNTVAAPLVALYNTTFDPDQVSPITPNNLTDLYLSNNGQFRLQVPEPGSLALIGVALLGFVGARRRKN